jgi:hypothetical protein
MALQSEVATVEDMLSPRPLRRSVTSGIVIALSFQTVELAALQITKKFTRAIRSMPIIEAVMVIFVSRLLQKLFVYVHQRLLQQLFVYVHLSSTSFRWLLFALQENAWASSMYQS